MKLNYFLYAMLLGMVPYQAFPASRITAGGDLTNDKGDQPKLTLAILSDLHNQQSLISGSVESVALRGVVQNTLNTLKQRENIDVLVLNGDFTSDVSISQQNWERIRDLIHTAAQEVFPSQAKKKPVLYVNGNHEYEVAKPDWTGAGSANFNAGEFYQFPMKQHVGELQPEERFMERTLDDKFDLLAGYHYVINGFDFVCLNAGKYFYRNAWDYQYSIESVRWIEQRLATIFESDPEKTVFFMAHIPFNDSKGISNSNKGLVNNEATALLKATLAKYPNLIYLYGHDHGTDAGYIREETQQRVTLYDEKGNLFVKQEAVEPTENNEYLIQDINDKYLGYDVNLNILNDKNACIVTSANSYFNIKANASSETSNIYFSSGSLTFSGNRSAKDLSLYKINETTDGTSTATKVMAITDHAQYLIVYELNGTHYALTNQPKPGTSGADLRMLPVQVSVSGDNATYVDENTTDSYSALWNISANKEEELPVAKQSFFSAFVGSMRYYNNTIDGNVGASNSKVVQAMMVYVYDDRVVLQMKNYGETGELNGITIAETPAAFISERNVTHSEIVEPEEENKYPQLHHTFSKADQMNRFLNKVTYKVEGNSEEEIFDLGVLTTSDAIPVNIENGGSAMVSYLSPEIELPYGTTSFDLTCFSTHGYVGGLKNNMSWVNQAVFVDWNQDYDFLDENEHIHTTTEGWKSSSATDHPFKAANGYTKRIPVPANLSQGVYRMYVVYAQGPTDSDVTWAKNLFVTNNDSIGNTYEFNIRINDIADGMQQAISATQPMLFMKDHCLHISNLDVSCEITVTTLTGVVVCNEFAYRSEYNKEMPASDNKFYLVKIKNKDRNYVMKVINQ